mgnify:CR=1 FL=1
MGVIAEVPANNEENAKSESQNAKSPGRASKTSPLGQINEE